MHTPSFFTRFNWPAPLLAVALILLAVGSAAANPVDGDYRWIGGSGSGWSTAANWHVYDDGAWVSAATAPTATAAVFLGDASGAGGQTLEIDSEVTVSRIIFEATGDRSYTITAANGGTLALTDASSIEIATAASQHLTLAVPTGLKYDGGNTTTFNFNSTAGGRLVIDAPVDITSGTTSNRLALSRSGTAIDIDMEVRQPLASANRMSIANTVRVLANPATTDRLFPTISPGSVMQVSGDADLTGQMWFLPANARFEIVDAGDDDVTISVGSVNRGGNPNGSIPAVVHIASPADASTGALTMVVNDIWVGATDRVVPSFQIDSGNFLQLDGDQSQPISIDNASGIHGAGALIKDSSGVSEVGDKNTYSGGTYIHNGTLRLEENDVPITRGSETTEAYAGHLGGGVLHIASGGTFDMNGLDQTVAGLNDLNSSAGTVALGGGTLTVDSTTASSFSGAISGTGAVVKSGAETFTIDGDYTNVAGRLLRVEEGLLSVAGTLDIAEGTFELAGGRIQANSLDAAGVLFNLTLNEALSGQNLLEVTNADITSALLNLALADDFSPEIDSQFTLVYASDTILGASAADMFGYADGDLIAVGDATFRINWVLGSESIVLTAIPEPATAALAFAVLAILAASLRRRKG